MGVANPNYKIQVIYEHCYLTILTIHLSFQLGGGVGVGKELQTNPELCNSFLVVEGQAILVLFSM